jgi:hypothetical protein
LMKQSHAKGVRHSTLRPSDGAAHTACRASHDRSVRFDGTMCFLAVRVQMGQAMKDGLTLQAGNGRQRAGRRRWR